MSATELDDAQPVAASTSDGCEVGAEVAGVIEAGNVGVADAAALAPALDAVVRLAEGADAGVVEGVAVGAVVPHRISSGALTMRLPA